MQCPNCGKEAINVNGKYVCLDCGVELSSPDLNTQTTPNEEVQPNESPQNISASTPGDDQAEPPLESQPDQPKTQEAPQPTQSALSQEESMSQPAEPTPEEIKKPVEEEFVNELKVSQEPTDTGSYDFSNNQLPEEQKPQPVVPTLDTNVTNEQTQEIPKAEDFFQPNSFDIKNETKEEVEGTEPQPEETTNQIQPDFPVTEDVQGLKNTDQSVNINEPVDTNQNQIDQTQEPVIPLTQEPETSPQPSTDAQETPQEVTDPVAPVGNTDLDSLLNKYNNPSPADLNPAEETNQPQVTEPTENIQNPVPINGVDNVQPTVPGMNDQGTMAPQPTGNDIPSVESVFGNNPQNEDITSPTGTPDQKSGLGNVGRRMSGKLWIIIAAVVGGLLLLGGLGFGVYYFINSQQETPQEKLLSEIEVSDLSGKVQEAMKSVQNISVNFEETIDYSELTKVEKQDEAQATQSTTHTNSGYWEIDSDGDAYISNSINGTPNKRTYLNDSKKTFVYLQKEEKYDEIDGFQIVNNPKLFEIEADERGSILYSTNIESLTEMPKVLDEGIEYRKIKAKFTQEYLKLLISVYDEGLLATDYEEFNTDNLNIYVYIDPENRIKEIDVSGSLSIKSSAYNGVISVSERANYTYDEIVITNPTEQVKETVQEEPEEVAVVPRTETIEPKQVNETEEIVEPEEDTIDVRG